jgi:peptidoglycan/LPS O-acetylase OafA/YrhL
VATRFGETRYLEGLRGIAAIQVVLLHFCTGFLPDFAEHAWPPLRVLFDGHTAVYVFFLISGAVLTPSFARPGPILAKLSKRVARLGIPVAAAAIFAAALLALMPQSHVLAAALSRSGWLAMDSSGAATLGHLFREIGLDSVLLGYRETTLFSPMADHMPPMEQSLDAPFWSLHLESYGSLLVLALVRLRVRSVWLHRAAIAALALMFGTHPMFLFVLGHLSAPLLARLPSARLGALGVALLVLGAALCATKDWRMVEFIRIWLSRGEFGSAPNLFQFQSQIGALALYCGVLLCPAARRLLTRDACCYLGRLSFGIYLLHFPIMFTLSAAAFVELRRSLPYAASVAGAFAVLVILTLAAAVLFERWIDRPAIRFSRNVEGVRWRSVSAIVRAAFRGRKTEPAE